MEQPLTLHWQSAEGYYTALLTPDLFGGWVLITASGQRGGRAGRVQHKPIASHAQGVEAIQELRQKRRHEGYTLCSMGFIELADFNPHSPGNRAAETDALMRVMTEWGLDGEARAQLLDVSPSLIEDFLDGKPMPDEPELLSRAGHLLAIYKALRQLHAGAPGLAHAWVRQPNPRFDRTPPLEIMRASLDGLLLIRRYLESEAIERSPG